MSCDVGEMTERLKNEQVQNTHVHHHATPVVPLSLRRRKKVLSFTVNVTDGQVILLRFVFAVCEKKFFICLLEPLNHAQN